MNKTGVQESSWQKFGPNPATKELILVKQWIHYLISYLLHAHRLLVETSVHQFAQPLQELPNAM